MSKEYRISILNKVLYCIFPLIFTIPFILSLHGQLRTGPMIGIIVTLVVSGLVLYIQNKRRILIDQDGILYNTGLKEKAMLFSQMEGFQVVRGKNAFIRIVGKEVPELRIGNYGDFSDDKEIIATLLKRTKDIDAPEREERLQEVLQDATMGDTKEERQEALVSYTRISLYYGASAYICVFVFILKNWEWIYLLPLIWPLLGLALLINSKGKLKFVNMKKGSPMPNIVLGFGVPCLVLLMTSLNSYSVLDFSSLWLPAIISGFILAFLLYKFGINLASGKLAGQIAIMVIVSMMYSFGACIFLNKALDNAPAQIYPASVLDRGVSHGKSTTYWITLTNFGPYKGAHRMSVSHSLYNFVQIGDTVKVDVHPGKLKLVWYNMETPLFNPPTVQQ